MHKEIWIIIEQKNGKTRPISYETLSEGRRLANRFNYDLVAVALDPIEESNLDLLRLYGVNKLLVASNEKVVSVSNHVQIVTGLIKEMTPYMVIGNATSMGNDLFQQLSATLKVPVIFDCIKTIIENEALFLVKTCYDGKILQKLTFNNCVPILFTLTPNAFKSAEHILPNKPKTVKVSIKKYLKKVRARLIDVVDYSSENLDLTEADKIISGGRGIKGENNFKLIEELANLIGASVGASRAAVESGWRPHTYQIGQTGKKVFPKIYIACGISGSTQHIAGMKDSKVIIAINKDPNAPIFKISDYGIVDDCLNVLPAMIKTVKKFQKKENLSKT